MTDFPPGSSQPPPWQGSQPPGPGYQPLAPGYQARMKVRPGRIWYLVPLALAVAGVVWLVVGLTSVVSTVDGLQRVPLPGGGTVNLTHSGGYTLYYEGIGARSGQIPAFHVNVAPVSPGAVVSSLTRYGSALTYDVGSHQGRAVLALRVGSPGSFRVTAVGAPSSGADLAVGASIGSGIVGTVAPSIPLIIVGILAAIVLLIVRIVRKRLQQRAF
jgi:hypothetical protein